MKFVQKLFSNRFYKFLFYILPLLFVCYFLSYIYYFNNINKNVVKQKINFPQKEKSIKLFDFAKDLEKKIHDNAFEVKNLRIASNSVTISIEGEFIKCIRIIDFVEKYSAYLDIKRASFEVIGANKIDLDIEVELTKNVNYYKNKIAKKFTTDILYQQNNGIIPQKTLDNKEMIISAIIDNRVLINNIWYKVGSFVNDKKIILINSDHIALEQDGNIKKIWMYDNEFTR